MFEILKEGALDIVSGEGARYFHIVALSRRRSDRGDVGPFYGTATTRSRADAKPQPRGGFSREFFRQGEFMPIFFRVCECVSVESGLVVNW